MVTPYLILVVFALVFMGLATFNVPAPINWMCASFACLIGTLLVGHA